MIGFSKYLKNEKYKLLMLLIAIFMSTLLKLKSVDLISQFIDNSLKLTKGNILVNLAITYMIVALLNILVTNLISYLSQLIGWNTTNRIREQAVEKCLKLDLSFYSNKSVGDMLELIDEDVNNLFSFYSQMVTRLLCNSILLIGVLIVFFRIDYRVGLLEMFFSFFIIFMFMMLKRRGVEIRKEDRALSTELMGFVSEVIKNTQDLKGNGLGNYIFDRYSKIRDRWFPVRLKFTINMWTNFMMVLFLQVVGYSICFIAGTNLWRINVISIGTIYMFFSYTKFILDPINEISNQFQHLQKVGASVDRLKQLFDEETSIFEGGLNNVPEITKLEMHDVNFSYMQNSQVLHNVNISVNKNRPLALLGTTGSGKTTIMRLISRLYSPDSGSIRINEVSIEDYSYESLLEEIAYITQVTKIFNASIRDNISLFDSKICDEHIMNAINDLNLTNWFKKFDGGLDTLLGSNGYKLSAGEEQLISLVRGLLKNPQIVLLDEITSNLDVVTENYVYKAIDQFLKNRIGIIIAHRVQTLNIVDQVVILENGKVIEYGSRNELICDELSNYYSLLNTQMEEEKIG